MAKKSLKQQLDGKPKKQPKPKSDKWVPSALIIILAVFFVLLITIGTVLLVRQMNMTEQAVDALPNLETSQVSDGNLNYSANGSYDTGSYESGSYDAAGGTSASGYPQGTVSGTTYHSSFAGVTFTAPSDWSVTSSSTFDLEAKSADNNSNVKIEFLSTTGGQYGSAAEVIAALKSSIDVSDDNIHETIGGHDFVGFRFKGDNGNGSNAYSELLGTDVNGYAMIIQIIAPSVSDINTILGMFS